MFNQSSFLSKGESVVATAACSLFVFAYFLSFEIGTFLTLRVRIDEVATILVMALLVYIFASKRPRSTVLEIVISSYAVIYLYTLAITAVGWVIFSWNLTGVIYLARDLQYFAVGLLFFLAMSVREDFAPKRLGPIEKSVILAVCLNLAWCFYQVVSGDYRGHYAVAAIGLEGSSASSGISYYAGLVLCAYFYAKTGHKGLPILMVLSLSGVLLTSNRTFSFAALVFLASWFFLYSAYVLARMLKKGKVNRSVLAVPGLVLAILGGVLLVPDSFITDNRISESLTSRTGVVSRFARIEEGWEKRTDLIGQETEEISKSWIGFIFGSGKGQYEQQVGKFKVGMHSQFSRLINEVGIVGVLMWTLLFGILAFAFTNNNMLTPSLQRVAISFLVSFYFTFFSYDVLLIAKSGFLFWIFVFLIFAEARQRPLMILTRESPELRQA